MIARSAPARERAGVRQLWAYAYRVVPPPAATDLGELRTLLDHENAAAFKHARAWAAQLILEQRSAQILVVTDTPARDRSIDRRVESELHRLAASYRVTDPVAIRGPMFAPALGATPAPASP